MSIQDAVQKCDNGSNENGRAEVSTSRDFDISSNTECVYDVSQIAKALFRDFDWVWNRHVETIVYGFRDFNKSSEFYRGKQLLRHGGR